MNQSTRIAVFILLFASARLSAQQPDSIFTPGAVESVEKALASDEMRGRASFTPDIERAADYIESQFRQAGLQTWNGSNSYRQPFSLVRARLLTVTGFLDDIPIDSKDILVVSSSAQLRLDNSSGYETGRIKAGDNIGQAALHYIGEKKNYLVWVDTAFAKSFPRLSRFAGQQFKSDRNIVFVLTARVPGHYSIKVDQDVKESKLANVVGMLPGKTKKKEYVIFSGHYDHLGVGRPDAKGDTIYNGANDDASGTTAVILLARYFAGRKDNERTLVFAAFTAEEIGEYGSQYFSGQFDPNAVVAMFNIEMIGTPSKWGRKSAFITGYEKSDLAKILEKNLTGSGFTLYPDPYPDQQLFYRSDNASLARKGVPAHTISTTQIDVDRTYHTPGDEIGTLDLGNLAGIIMAIAISSKTIVDGKDTPSRVDATQLR